MIHHVVSLAAKPQIRRSIVLFIAVHVANNDAFLANYRSVRFEGYKTMFVHIAAMGFQMRKNQLLVFGRQEAKMDHSIAIRILCAFLWECLYGMFLRASSTERRAYFAVSERVDANPALLMAVRALAKNAKHLLLTACSLGRKLLSVEVQDRVFCWCLIFCQIDRFVAWHSYSPSMLIRSLYHSMDNTPC